MRMVVCMAVAGVFANCNPTPDQTPDQTPNEVPVELGGTIFNCSLTPMVYNSIIGWSNDETSELDTYDTECAETADYAEDAFVVACEDYYTGLGWSSDDYKCQVDCVAVTPVEACAL